MSLWKVYIGQGGSRFLQPRIVNIKITEMFGNVNFSVTIKSPTEAERNQVKGRMDTAIIQIVRGTTVSKTWKVVVDMFDSQEDHFLY